MHITLLGFGYWGQKLARTIVGIPDMELQMICDPNPSLLARAAYEYPTIKVQENWDCAADHSEAVVIATPPPSHYSLALAALRSNKHVLIEKPTTLRREQTEHLLRVAKARDRILLTDYTFLHHSSIHQLRRSLGELEFGNLRRITSRRLNLGKFQRSVNVLYDLAAHDVALALYLYGELPLAVQCIGSSSQADLNVLDTVYVHFFFAEGRTYHAEVSWLWREKVRTLTAVCDRGVLEFDDVLPSGKLRATVPVRVQAQSDTFIYENGRTFAFPDEDADALTHLFQDFRSLQHDRSKRAGQWDFEGQVNWVLATAQQSLNSNGQRLELQDFMSRSVPIVSPSVAPNNA